VADTGLQRLARPCSVPWRIYRSLPGAVAAEQCLHGRVITNEHSPALGLYICSAGQAASTSPLSIDVCSQIHSVNTLASHQVMLWNYTASQVQTSKDRAQLWDDCARLVCYTCVTSSIRPWRMTSCRGACDFQTTVWSCVYRHSTVQCFYFKSQCGL
jgi:hypothetical protein